MSYGPGLTPYSDLLQVANGALMIVLSSMVLFFAWYVVRKWCAWRYRGGAGFYGEVKPAFAMLTFVLGEGALRFIVWYVRYEKNLGVVTPLDPVLVSRIIIVSTIVAVVGGLCVVRVFSPVRYRGAPWAATIVAILVFLWLTWPR